jgi:putative FmdB family regulatory protein
MPVYEYCCNNCNNHFDLRQKFSDPPVDRCPKCGGIVRKMVSAASFSLKGAGWYGDGYGTKVESNKSEGDTAAGSGVAIEGTSTDSAPAELAASSATQAPTPTQVEKKSSVVETPTPAKDKSDVKPDTSSRKAVS